MSLPLLLGLFALVGVLVTAVVAPIVTLRIAKREQSGSVETSTAGNLWATLQGMLTSAIAESTAARAESTALRSELVEVRLESTTARTESAALRVELGEVRLELRDVRDQLVRAGLNSKDGA